MNELSKKLIIIEGPDGAGKSTLAKKLCALYKARYVHLGPLPHVTTGLPRIYHEAMLPALLGYQPVVMDRAWHSEVPYGQVFRGGKDRLGVVARRMLERTAMRCGAVVVYCKPDEERLEQNFKARKGLEYLDSVDQLKQVASLYKKEIRATSKLPVLEYDYTQDPDGTELFLKLMSSQGPLVHSLCTQSAGNLLATMLIVGDSFAEMKNEDPLTQYPFVSYQATGCSQWLTWHLEQGGITEGHLCWVNADQDLQSLVDSMPHLELIVALGSAAEQAVDRFDPVLAFQHPQHHRRFKAKEEYPLAAALNDYLAGAYTCGQST